MQVTVAIDPLSSSRDSSDESSASTKAMREEALGRDAFLQLLLVQLQNQDPTSPQSNTEFIAQLAQFSSLEQLTNIDDTLKGMAGAMGVVLPEKSTTKKA